MYKTYLLNYAGGNIESVRHILHVFKIQFEEISEPLTLDRSDLIIFPGQGHFGQAMEFLKSNHFVDMLVHHINHGGNYLGICLGMQILFEGSAEDPETKGLGLFPGKLIKFPQEYIVPQMGWNQIQLENGSNLYLELENEYFYFAHSYLIPLDLSAELEKKGCTYGMTQYEDTAYISAIFRPGLLALQFHPEKSQGAGFILLKKFFRKINVI